jgi:signal transduction histidine kinase
MIGSAKRSTHWSGQAMQKLFLACFLIPLIPTATQPASNVRSPRTVLVIYSNDRSLPANRQIDDALRETLAVHTTLDLIYQTEFLDYPRYEDTTNESYDKLIAEFLRAKYAGRTIDLVVAAGPEAFLFLRRHQNDLFADIPCLVIGIIKPFFQDQPLSARFLIIPIAIEPLPTLEMATHLQPGAGELVVVTGTSNFDLGWERRIMRNLSEWQNHPPVRYLKGLPLDDVLNELSRLPHNSIVYTLGMQKDANGRTFASRDVVHHMAEASAAPLYSSYSTMIGFGIVGGYVFEMADVGRQAGQMAQRILAGEKLTQNKMPDGPPSHYVVDWNQMKRWHLSEASLPPDTIIVNRELSVWQKYQRYIAGALLLLVLQSFLIFYLMAERRRRQLTQEQLAERLRFETLVAQISSEFANVEEGRLDQTILNSLRSVQEFFRSSIACIWQPQSSGSRFLCTHQWPQDLSDGVNIVPPDDFPGTVRRLLRGENVLFSGETELSDLEDCASFRKAEIRTFLAIPIQNENHRLGALSLVNFSDAAPWPADVLPRLNTIVNILGGALTRQNASEALHESEVVKGVILEYMHGSVVVIDNYGRVIEMNRDWAESVTKDGVARESGNASGVDYLDVCAKVIGGPGAIESQRGIRSVLSGSRQMFEIEYASPDSSEPQWFRMTAMRLPRAKGGALVVHLDITQQKLAELERETMQEQTAQLHRASEMGQLVASLAHELAQPLGAVLSNAQAAVRLAARPEPDRGEILAALVDIVEDDQRASAVLDNVRGLLKKHAVTPHKVNLNEIIENVILMVRSGAQLRGVQLRPVLSDDAVLVQGDEVPLQQVLLNLVNNAMDAMSQVPLERRVLILKTAIQTQSGSGLLVVEDRGPGVPESLKAKLFQPFFTTKSEGLGMGLAICHTILATLGGSIELQDRPEPGATFRVVLPLA